MTATHTTGSHLWLVLMKAHRSMQGRAVASIESFDLGLSEFAILELLLHKGAQKVNEIGRRVHLTSGSITTAVDRLESRGLVARELDAADRRSRIVHLTASGRRHIRTVFACHEKALENAASALTGAERKTLATLLVKLGRSIDDAQTP